jgi:hypothetical protein
MTRKPINGGLLLTIWLPIFAVTFSVGAAIVAFTRGDATLPDEYHWEGMQLDRDFAGAHRAAELDVRAMLALRDGVCRLTLQLEGPPPETVLLGLVHATRPDLDQHVRLSRVGQLYEGRCQPSVDGHWHMEIADLAGTWSVRRDWTGSLDGARLSAR